MRIFQAPEQKLNLIYLLRILSSSEYVTLEIILKTVNYPSARSLGRDIEFLRKSFNVKISYSRHFHAYHLENTGDFLMIINPEKAV